MILDIYSISPSHCPWITLCCLSEHKFSWFLLCVALCWCLKDACFYVDAKIKVRREFRWLAHYLELLESICVCSGKGQVQAFQITLVLHQMSWKFLRRYTGTDFFFFDRYIWFTKQKSSPPRCAAKHLECFDVFRRWPNLLGKKKI